jgi:hypothetical protein
VSSSHQHESFKAYELAVEDNVEPDVLLERLRGLSMLRAKGFVHTSGGLRLLQGVGRRLELLQAPVTPPAAIIGRVVVICREARSSGAPDNEAFGADRH